MVKQFGKVFLPRLIIALAVGIPLIIWINNYRSAYNAAVVQNQETLKTMQSESDQYSAQVDKLIKFALDSSVEFNNYAKANDPNWQISNQQLHDKVWGYQLTLVPQSVADKENELFYASVHAQNVCVSAVDQYNSWQRKLPASIHSHSFPESECYNV